MIKACINCGNAGLRVPNFDEGSIVGVADVGGVYFCPKCGKKGIPLVFEKERDYKRFLSRVSRKK